MTKTLRAGATGLLLSLAIALPAGAATSPVSVRVEGAQSTLLARTGLTPPDRPEPDTGCAADSAANALDAAVANNWDNQQFTQTILGETHKFDNNDYWSFWVFRGGRYVVSNGICDEKLASGEELLAAYEVSDPSTYAPTIHPLWLENVPATVAPGSTITVTVAQAACETDSCNPGEGHRTLRSGATVTAGAATATSGADGTATLTLSGRGPVAVRATAPGATPSASEPSCVTDGTDGYCGTAKCQTNGHDGLCGSADKQPAAVTITGIREGQAFSRSKAPRELTATVAADPSGLHAVKLGLSRSYRGHCWTLSGKQERFRTARCGHHALFTVGTDADVSYLLPARLGPGRYVLDVISIDGKFNRDAPARGRNRVVFAVK